MSVTNSMIYEVTAWKDNKIKLCSTQGEGVTAANATNTKMMKFRLLDSDGGITIPSCTLQLAITRPDGTNDLVSGTVLDGGNSIVGFPIMRSMTDIAGNAIGEIRMITSDNIIKFYGINFLIFAGINNDNIEQSPAFSALVEALQSVQAITAGGSVATLDTVIQHNGINPVASGIIYDFLVSNYVPTNRTIAGVDLQDNITKSELQMALDFNDKMNKAPEINNSSAQFAIEKGQFYGSPNFNDLYLKTGAAGTTPNKKIAFYDDVPTSISELNNDVGFVDHLPTIHTGVTNKSASETGTSTKQYYTNDIYCNRKTGELWMCTNVVFGNGVYTYSWVSRGFIFNITDFKPTTIDYTLDGEDWNNGSQIVDVSSDYTVTSYTKADIDFNATVCNALIANGTQGIYIENIAGVLTCKCLGNVPLNDITIQITLTEIQ